MINVSFGFQFFEKAPHELRHNHALRNKMEGGIFLHKEDRFTWLTKVKLSFSHMMIQFPFRLVKLLKK
jgi:gluconate kinase